MKIFEKKELNYELKKEIDLKMKTFIKFISYYY